VFCIQLGKRRKLTTNKNYDSMANGYHNTHYTGTNGQIATQPWEAVASKHVDRMLLSALS